MKVVDCHSPVRRLFPKDVFRELAITRNYHQPNKLFMFYSHHKYWKSNDKNSFVMSSLDNIETFAPK